MFKHIGESSHVVLRNMWIMTSLMVHILFSSHCEPIKKKKWNPYYLDLMSHDSTHDTFHPLSFSEIIEHIFSFITRFIYISLCVTACIKHTGTFIRDHTMPVCCLNPSESIVNGMHSVNQLGPETIIQCWKGFYLTTYLYIQ